MLNRRLSYYAQATIDPPQRMVASHFAPIYAAREAWALLVHRCINPIRWA